MSGTNDTEMVLNNDSETTFEESAANETASEAYGGITRRSDGSYVIDKGGVPYHVPDTEEFAEEFAAVSAYAAEHPDEVSEEQAPAEPTLAERKAAKRAEMAAARYAAEISGVTLSGTTIRTDRESQALITGAALAASQSEDETYSVTWKAQSGFVTLSTAQVIAVAQAVRQHVQDCFDREAELQAAIEAAETEEELNGITW